MPKVVIFGTGQTAEIAFYYLEQDSNYTVAAFTADAEYIKEASFNGQPVVPFEEVAEAFPASEYDMFVALSYKDLNRVRAAKYKEAKDKHYRLISYVSSKSNLVGDVPIGDNCMILESQSIQSYARIGNNVAIFGGVNLGHHSAVGDHCWVASGVSIGGNTIVGQHCFLGLNATIGHMIAVGADCFLGAGSRVTKNCQDGSVFIEKDTDRYRLDSHQFVQITGLK